MMHARIWALVFVAIYASPINAHDTSAVQVGSRVIISMTGDLAERYNHLLVNGDRVASSGYGYGKLSVSTSARVVEKLDDGRFRVKASSRTKDGSNRTTLLTLTATVDNDAIEKRVVPAGTLTYASPSDQNPVATKKPHAVYELHLDGLKGVQVRAWTLRDEFGEQ